MSTNHTAGPWHYKAPDEVAIHDAEGGRIAILANLRGALGMGGRRDPNEVIANARLIAAAPELLEALQEAVVALKHVQDALYVRVNPGTVEKAEAVISRALGQ
jgi:hypothetical protein